MLRFLRIERPTTATRRSSAIGGVDHLLEAVDVGRERRDHDPALAAREDLLQHRPDARLRRRRPDAVGVRRVAAQQQHALPPELGEPRGVGRRAVDGRLVELVVAGDQRSVPSSQVTATAHASGIECETWISSSSNGPASIVSPGSTSSNGTSLSLCSSIFERAIATVSGPP